MTALAPLLILVLIGGLLAVAAAVGQLWAANGGGEETVGPRQARRRAPEPPAIVPGALRTLIHGETSGWDRADQWMLLVQRLDELEASFGVVPSGQWPEQYSPVWLDHRLAEIEQLAGPLPAPLRPPATRPTSRRFWRRT